MLFETFEKEIVGLWFLNHMFDKLPHMLNHCDSCEIARLKSYFFSEIWRNVFICMRRVKILGFAG